MAEFCQTCSIKLFGEDMKDFANFCSPEEMIEVLCEGCGLIYVDKNGKGIIFIDKD